jgi:hypothetical protein
MLHWTIFDSASCENWYEEMGFVIYAKSLTWGSYSLLEWVCDFSDLILDSIDLSIRVNYKC